MRLKLFLLVGLLFFGVTASTEAATLYMSPNQATLNRGDTITVSVRLDVDRDECVNVIDGVVEYSANIEPLDVARGSSILSLWVEDPIINKANRTITFAGGIPNGYCGRIVGDPRLTNNIIDLVFQSPGFVIGSKQGTSTQEARIDFSPETMILLNDNYGTRANANLYGATFALTSKTGNSADNSWLDQVATDNQPPQEFSISLNRTPNAFSNDYFITFNTTDKQSGIDHYEVIEEPIEQLPFFTWGREDAPWVEARSPYVLKDQSLNKTIRVRAIDKAGNEYIATLIPDEDARSISTDTIVLLAVLGVGLLVLIVSFVVFILLMVRSRRRKLQQINDAADTLDDDNGDEVEFDDELEADAVAEDELGVDAEQEILDEETTEDHDEVLEEAVPPSALKKRKRTVRKK